MAADFTRIRKRVTEILNANDAGTFSETISARNKTRNADAIEAACIEAAMRVMQTVCEPVGSEYRKDFLQTVPVNYKDTMPVRVGKPSMVEIEPYAGGAWREADQKDYRKIEAWRRNPNNIYDNIAHNAAGSSLAGFYDIWNDIIYFTGNACRVTVAVVSRDDVTTKIPDVWENTVIKLAVAFCMKAGEGGYTIGMADRYQGSAENDLARFTGGKQVYKETSDGDLLTPAKSN